MQILKLIPALFIALVVISCNEDDPTRKPIEITAADLTLNIDENASVGTVLGSATATASRGDLTYSIVSQVPADAVAIGSATGQLTVNDEAAFDYEANQEIIVTVAIMAEDDESETIQATINVNNVAETVSLFFSHSTIDENSLNGAIVTTVTSSTDLGMVQYTLTGGATDIFEINSSGQLLVKDGAQLDFETLNQARLTSNILSVTIQGTNSLNNSVASSAVMEITVNDISGTNEIDERLSQGQTFLQAYEAKNSNLDLIIGYYHQGGLIGHFDTSTGTGLIVTAMDLMRTYSQAVSLLNGTNINGYTDWRLMTRNEALAMCAYEDKLYQASVWSWFWTSTASQFGHYAYIFGSTADGSCSESAPSDSNTLFIRAVREF